MTELETLERAKMYMEKLANGINPIDGTLEAEIKLPKNALQVQKIHTQSNLLQQKQLQTER